MYFFSVDAFVYG